MKRIEVISNIGQLSINAFYYYPEKSKSKKRTGRLYVTLFSYLLNEIGTFEVADLTILEGMRKINDPSVLKADRDIP